MIEESLSCAPCSNRIDRHDVAEISRVHRNAAKGAGWGVLVGAGAGLATTFASCGTHWNTESSSCGNLSGVGLVIFPVLGAFTGALVGNFNYTAALVYRAP